MNVVQIISGGQTGVDIAALRAAARLGLATGGFAPVHFMTERGPDPTLGTKYGLVEMGPPTDPLPKSYVRRSMANVDASDATIAISLGPSIGTDKTIGYACTKVWKPAGPYCAAEASEFKTAYRPIFVIHMLDPAAQPTIVVRARKFLETHRPRIVNVCGHRAWTTIPDFESVVENLLVKIFES